MNDIDVVNLTETLGDSNKTLKYFESSDDDLDNPIVKKKSHVKTFSASENEESDENDGFHTIKPFSEESSNVDNYTSLPIEKKKLSRIKSLSSDESGSDNNQNESKELKKDNINNPSRITNKRVKIKTKFMKLLNSREKKSEMDGINSKIPLQEITENSGDPIHADDEITSIDEIKKNTKERSSSLTMAVIDPDTSDEDNSSQTLNIQWLKKQQKCTKLTSPKHKRMSAKQAIENMQKIKSESNRMLREKEVSLPYHRPKALNLKDIINRRKPAVSSDGKALPIKMNADQLKQYACLLEQRQKEMMELCKSDTDDDDEPENNELNSASNISTITIAEVENVVNEEAPQIDNEICDDLSANSKILGHNETHAFDVDDNDEKGCHSDSISIEDSPSTKVEKADSESKENKMQSSKSEEHEIVQDVDMHINDSIHVNNSNGVVENVSVNKESGTEYRVTENVSDCKSTVSNMIVDIKECLEVDKMNASVYGVEMNLPDQESQLISLQYDSEKIDLDIVDMEGMTSTKKQSSERELAVVGECEFPNDDADLDDLNIEDIDNLIEKAEILNHKNENIKSINSPAIVKEAMLGVKPKLTGAPGMIIDLDGSDPIAPKKLTGVELLKERFTFFSKLKTPEEFDREKEKRQKPGTQHIKLKQELEDKIAEQRSIEWAKRLENEKQQRDQLESAKTNDSNVDDDIDKIEKELEETENANDILSTEDEDDEDLIENDVLIQDKPRNINPLVDDEAEVSDLDHSDHQEYDIDNVLEDHSNNQSEDDSSSEDESSESEQEDQSNIPRKSRILKAFEDSDDDGPTKETKTTHLNTNYNDIPYNSENKNFASISDENEKQVNTQDIIDINSIDKAKSNFIDDSQDDVLQLAQIPKKISEELFTSQESGGLKQPDQNTKSNICSEYEHLSTQTFSIVNDNNTGTSNLNLELDGFANSAKIDVISETQPFDDNLDAVVGMCSGSFSQNYIEISPPKTQIQDSQSQKFGEDLLNMCTGKFYDNQFISQCEKNIADDSKSIITNNCGTDDTKKCVKENVGENTTVAQISLDEILNECETSKPLKYFFDSKNQNKGNENNISNSQLKKKFVIDSEDEAKENVIERKKTKRLKKRRLEKRVLQISDDEDENSGQNDDLFSDNDDIKENIEERLVEYDSEENEIEVKPQNPKKKRKTTEFFEQEAELTSEDEWVGSGDEDEADLDRMEREAGDDDTFNQNQLQRELGQIHMRDVLDQDKREVRIIQELLFEDGDLGGGGRQRKFRWRNADGDEVTGTLPDEFADTQEEEFESEELWRKQRHERDMFLRQMKNEDEINVTLDRTAIIKANLNCRTMSSLLEEANKSKMEEANKSKIEEVENPPAPEKKTVKDIPSPKKPYAIFQKNYHGSLLSRGRGALERLAALATPLAGDDDKPASVLPPSTRRNFVFAALTPDTEDTKVTKRKAETAIRTPQLVKKMRTEDKKPKSRSSLLDHFKA